MRTICLFLFSLLFYTGFAQDPQPVWDFPIKPGNNKWKALKSHKEMVDICQIPSSIINNLNTSELVRICLDYPLFFTLTAFNNMQMGFEQNKNDFNGFLELFKRKDAGKELISFYSKINPGEVMSMKSNLDKGNFMFRIFYLEILLAQKDLLSTLNQEEQRILLTECLEKIQEKNNALYSRFQTQTTYLIMTRILILNQFSTFMDNYRHNQSEYDWFVNGIVLPSTDLFIEIKTSTEDYLLKRF
jgi:hypothetical protein